MIVALVVGVLGLLTIAFSATVAPRLRIASPLLLTVLGIGVSLLPAVPDVELDPEWIIAGILPPLLYAASVAMPAMDFRREFRAISGLSVVLVVVTALVIGGVAVLLVPGLGLATGVALGAIVSPTDAVATRIVRGLGVSPRITAVLEGESLLNDASALVLLRTAVAATAAAVSLGGVLWDFGYSVAVAIGIGAAVALVTLRVRATVADPTVNTVISFTVPFLASVPAEILGASGLVAAVVAGLVTGQGAVRYLRPEHRISDRQNWRTIELVLEGAVFLTMGLELAAVLGDVQESGSGIGVSIVLAALTVVLVLGVRAAYVGFLLVLLRRRTRRAEATRTRYVAFESTVDGWAAGEAMPSRGGRTPPEATPERVERIRSRLRRGIADVDYLMGERLGWREGSVIVWAGMRGAVTLAAAQTLPRDADHRSVLVFVAFMVAVISLFVQGGTLPLVVRLVRPARVDPAAEAQEELALVALLREVAMQTLAQHGDDPSLARWKALLPPLGNDEEDAAGAHAPHRLETEHRLRTEILEAQRAALLQVRQDGTFSSAALSVALDSIDASQMSLELRGRLGAQDRAG